MLLAHTHSLGLCSVESRNNIRLQSLPPSICNSIGKLDSCDPCAQLCGTWCGTPAHKPRTGCPVSTTGYHSKANADDCGELAWLETTEKPCHKLHMTKETKPHPQSDCHVWEGLHGQSERPNKQEHAAQVHDQPELTYTTWRRVMKPTYSSQANIWPAIQDPSRLMTPRNHERWKRHAIA